MKFLDKTLHQMELIQRCMPNVNHAEHEITYTIAEISELCAYVESLINIIKVYAPKN